MMMMERRMEMEKRRGRSLGSESMTFLFCST